MEFSFAIKYKDVFLDLEEDTYLTVDWFSTLFNESEIFRGSYSYAIKLKLSDKNLAILKMPHLLENRTSRVKYNVSVILFGQTWKNAILEIELASGALSGNLLIDNSIIANVLKETSLSDIFSTIDSFGKRTYSTFSIGDTHLEKLQYLNDSTDGRYPIVFPTFRNFGWDGTFSHESNRLINNYVIPFEQYLVMSTDDLYCPMFSIQWLAETICDKIGFKAIGSFFDNDEIAKWVLVNNSYYTGREILTEGFNIIIGRHLPNLTIGNFFKILRNDLKLPIYFDSLRKTVIIDLPNLYLERDQYVGLKENLVKDSLKIKGGELKKYVVQRSKSNLDAIYQHFDTIDSIALGNSEEINKPIELSLNTLKMSNYFIDRFNSVNHRIPITDHLANVYDSNLVDSSAFNKEGEFNKNEFPITIIAYRGLMQCVIGEPSSKIPYATSDNKDALGIQNNNWIATEALHNNGFIRILCQPFYQMLSITEDIEFDILLPINKFLDINPLSKIKYWSPNGSMSTMVLDKVTFEPSSRNYLIYSKIKAFSINRSHSIFSNLLQFRTESETDVPDVIYVFANFHHIRTDPGDPNGVFYVGKMLLEFFGDRYRVNPKIVSNLEIKLEVRRHIRTTQNEGIITFEKTYTTGSNVVDYQPTEEFIYKSTVSGSSWTSEIILLENEANKYIPGN